MPAIRPHYHNQCTSPYGPLKNEINLGSGNENLSRHSKKSLLTRFFAQDEQEFSHDLADGVDGRCEELAESVPRLDSDLRPVGEISEGWEDDGAEILPDEPVVAAQLAQHGQHRRDGLLQSYMRLLNLGVEEVKHGPGRVHAFAIVLDLFDALGKQIFFQRTR